jgi:hypothetical protein
LWNELPKFLQLNIVVERKDGTLESRALRVAEKKRANVKKGASREREREVSIGSTVCMTACSDTNGS